MDRIITAIQQSIEVKQRILGNVQIINTIEDIVMLAVNGYKNGNKVIFAGNGGSAADAQHLAAELTGKFYFDRAPLDAEALHVNTSYLTAVANDYAYDEVYVRALRAKAKKGDMLIALSTSGNSSNIIKAIKYCNDNNIITVGLTGATGGMMKDLCNHIIMVPSKDTPRIQEAHILIGHIICELIEKKLFL